MRKLEVFAAVEMRCPFLWCVTLRHTPQEWTPHITRTFVSVWPIAEISGRGRIVVVLNPARGMNICWRLFNIGLSRTPRVS